MHMIASIQRLIGTLRQLRHWPRTVRHSTPFAPRPRTAHIKRKILQKLRMRFKNEACMLFRREQVIQDLAHDPS